MASSVCTGAAATPRRPPGLPSPRPLSLLSWPSPGSVTVVSSGLWANAPTPRLVMPSLRSMLDNLVWAKAQSPTVPIGIALMLMFSRPELINASSSMRYSCVAGSILIPFSALQPLKAPRMMLCTPAPRVTLLNAILPRKAKSPTILALMTALVIDSQRENTPLPMSRMDDDSSMLVSPQPAKA